MVEVFCRKTGKYSMRNLKWIWALLFTFSCAKTPPYHPSNYPVPQPLPHVIPVKPDKPKDNGVMEALDEVNAVRAKRGLKPFIRDDGLTEGAMNVAKYRANHLIAGHTHNDFSFLPEGVSAQAAGCAAWPPDMGWGACCTYENWTYCGAAWAKGRDGKRYMHLFVAKKPS